jgi:hypothetical protein
MTIAIYPGDALKALDNGRIGGYLVVFGSPDTPDLTGDYFTPETDFGAMRSSPVWLNHRLPLETKSGATVVEKRQIGEAQLTIDDYGVLVDAVLYEAGKYAGLLARMGWSSGTASHLVDREPVKSAWRITRWPLGLDASLTPTPAEPRTLRRAVRNIDANPEALAEAAEAAPDAERRRIVTVFWR